jgi:peptide chain release factor subunit 3
MGTIVMGKIESGCCRVGDRCLLMPNRTRVEVTNIYYEDVETDSCVCGENVRLKLKNVEEEVSYLFLFIFSLNEIFRKFHLDSFYAILNKNHVVLEESLMHK